MRRVTIQFEFLRILRSLKTQYNSKYTFINRACRPTIHKALIKKKETDARK